SPPLPAACSTTCCPILPLQTAPAACGRLPSSSPRHPPRTARSEPGKTAPAAPRPEPEPAPVSTPHSSVSHASILNIRTPKKKQPIGCQVHSRSRQNVKSRFLAKTSRNDGIPRLNLGYWASFVT